MTVQQLRAEERRYPCRASSVTTMRREAVTILDEWGLADLADDAELCVSELATNAIQHRPRRSHACKPTEIELALVLTPAAGLRMEVRDAWPGIPHARTSSDDDEGGRGLVLVAALSARWGVEPVSHAGRRGKAVWCELALPTGWGGVRSQHTDPRIAVSETGDAGSSYRLRFAAKGWTEHQEHAVGTADLGPSRNGGGA